jgi:hypothetical protein
VQQPNPYQPTYGDLAFGSPGAPLAPGKQLDAEKPIRRRLPRGGKLWSH